MKNKKIVIPLSGMLILSIIYILGVFHFDSKFLSNTYINEVDVGGLSSEQAESKLIENSSWDEISILNGKELIVNIKSEDIDFNIVGSEEVYDLIGSKDKFKWVSSLIKDSDYNVDIIKEYDSSKIISIMSEVDKLNNDLKNAKLSYLDESMQFIIIPGVYEVTIDNEELLPLIEEGINNLDNSIDISEYIKHPEVTSENEDLIEASKRANGLLDIELTYNYGENSEVVDHSSIKDWIYSEGVSLEVDREKVEEFVVNMAKEYDTYGVSRDFKTSNGNVIKTSGGSYGWMTHRSDTIDSLIDSIKAGESKEVFPTYSYEAQSRSSNDIGDSYVEIDLQNQKVYVYNKGSLTVSSDVVTGDISRGFPTPVSIDPITYKTTNAILRGPGYETPVKYWMPFNGDVGLHDASWQSSFGGNAYKTRGSRGCINLPPSVAKKVYDNVYQGMPVIVY